MVTTLRRVVVSSIAVAAVFTSAAALAREWDAASELYGRGVHAYFAGRPNQADMLLSRALEINSRDPRLFYFRGLSRIRMGRGDDGRADMKSGAALEAERTNRYAVGTSLQRVQGSDRLLLEQFRRQARAEAVKGNRRDQFAIGPESQVLRERVVVPLDELLRPGGPRPLTAEELAGRGAFPQPSAPSAERTTTPALQPATTDDDPFVEESAAPEPADEIPTEPEPDTNEPASEPAESPEEPEADPFGDFN